MKHLVYILFLLNCTICTGQNILLNSDFSATNYGWQTSGSFHYDSRFQACKSCPGYAYFSNSNGTTSNNLFGELYQSVYVPANVTSATFAFSYSIHTDEPNTAANDWLNVSLYVGNTEVWRVIDMSNKFATTYPGGPANYQSFEVPVPQNLIPQMANSGISVVFRASNDGSNPTVFRLDDVTLNITTGAVGIRTGCVTWTNGNLPSAEVISAADNLCNQHYIGNTIDVQTLAHFNTIDASGATLGALYMGAVPSSLPSDNVPTFFGDIDKLPFDDYQAIKAMCYLESGDGRSCFNREHTFIYPYTQMAKGNILRMLCEAWNIPPDMQGYDVFNHSQSPFSNVIYNDDYNYGYFKRAFQENLLGNYVFNANFLDNDNVKPGEFYLVVLNNIVNRHGRRSVATTEYYNPNNVQLSNASVPLDITRGVFKSYEQSGFDLPSGGLGLSFIYSYHSDLVDIPSLGYSNYLHRSISLIEQLAKERIFPLGIGWTHTYNIYAQSVLDTEGKDRYIVIHWGDGSIAVYNAPQAKFESAGVYDKFVVNSSVGGHITNFNVISKDQVTTQFSISSNSDLRTPSFFQATLIRNQNSQSINLVYEYSNCTGAIEGCFGSSVQRLARVIDNFSNRILTFQYAPGSDLLIAVLDETGRKITFSVNRSRLNLEAVTNARKYITYYSYGQSDAENHLLLTITRPNGNTVNNTYADRKLKQTQTPEYLTKVDFKPSYSTSAIGTQSEITTIPSAGTQYSIKYTQSSFGTVSTVTSAGSDISLTYGDSQNPTLPTIVVDNKTNLRQNFRYDGMGNVLQNDYSGGGLTQTNRFTYDQANHVLTHTWPNNTVTMYTYDGAGNQTSETTSNYKVDYGYFPNGLIAVKTDANQVITNFGYNRHGNLNSLSISGTPIHYTASYDEASRLTSITDGNQIQTTYGYDESDNVQNVLQDPTGLKLQTVYSYDGNENLRDIAPPGGRNTSLTYNASDDLIKEQQLGLVREWTYNADGSVNSYIDKNHYLFSYSYYPTKAPNEGLLKSNGVETYYYNLFHHKVSSITSNESTINYAYDQLIRPNNIEFRSSSYNSTVSYEYDISGNMTKIVLVEEGKYFTYNYDELNRLRSIKDWNNKPLITYTYQNNGLLGREELGNGVSVNYHYDRANRLDSVYSLKSDGRTLIHAVGASLDNNSNHTRESLKINWAGTPGTIYPSQTNTAFSYDKEYNWLLTADSKSLTNDNSGNITNNYYSGLYSANYDVHNNLISCSVEGKQRKFLYDVLQNRYANDSLRYTVDHVNNGNVLATRKIGANSSQALYVYSPYGLVCSIDPQTTDATFYLYDFRGSTVATIDKTQSVTDYYKYDPWGNVSESSTAPGKSTPFLFLGKYGVMYESPHLYFMRARYYDPTLGRFLGGDPKWNTNLFSYADNNPVNNIDPYGQSAKSIASNGFKQYVKVLSKSVDYTVMYKIDFVGGALDFGKNYFDMRRADVIGSDKYFHAKANFQASTRGPGGYFFAVHASNLREIFGQYVKKDPNWDKLQDQEANIYGRGQAMFYNYNDYRKALEKYVVPALPSRY